MSKSTLSSILYPTIILLWSNAIYAQSDDTKRIQLTKNTPKTTISFNLQKQTGIGPSGNVSYGISSLNLLGDGEEIKGYPKVKNKPAGLHGEVEYFYKLDDFQFHYQNYCAGVYSKDFFLNKAKAQKWNIADTIKLSRIPIKCGFSVLAGYNNANEAVYIIDCDNNNDFGNDVLKPLSKHTNRNHTVGSTTIITEYLSGKEIKQEKILVSLTSGNGFEKNENQLELFFEFPEFRYARFNYQGESYIVCTDAIGMSRKFIYVIPDVPNFTSADTRIELNQFVRIGDKDFIFTGYEDNGNRITLAGNDLQNFSSAKSSAVSTVPKVKPGQNSTFFSNQIGYKAPVIKGYNINTKAKDKPFISTADLKGKYIFVDFWSSFCGPCIAEFPYLKEVYLKYDRKKLEIIGILDERDIVVTARLLKEGNLIWPNIKTNTKGSEINGYHIDSYPTSYLIDPEGTIIAVNLRGEELANKLKTLIK